MCSGKSGRCCVGLLLALAWLLGTALTASASQVRIVRLSYLDGDVRIQLSTAYAPQPAILNMPVTEGMRLTTGDNSYAEVEFENGSTLRLAGRGTLWFPQLSISDVRGRLSAVEVKPVLFASIFTLVPVITSFCLLAAANSRYSAPRISGFGRWTTPMKWPFSKAKSTFPAPSAR